MMELENPSSMTASNSGTGVPASPASANSSPHRCRLWWSRRKGTLPEFKIRRRRWWRGRRRRSKKYAVQSDWKAHAKVCGTREYSCDCGALFSRRKSFIPHGAFCDALAGETMKTKDLSNTNPKPRSGSR